jgi:hypothetical protein
MDSGVREDADRGGWSFRDYNKQKHEVLYYALAQPSQVGRTRNSLATHHPTGGQVMEYVFAFWIVLFAYLLNKVKKP